MRERYERWSWVLRASAVLWDSGWVSARRTMGAGLGIATEWAFRRGVEAMRVGLRGTVRRTRRGRASGSRGGIF